MFFRKDVSPDPTRIEIILELGHFTTTGTTPLNLGPFSLQILKAGVPQNIPANTASGAGNTWVPGGSTFTGTTQVTTGYAPSMGWWTRWRWNPTPRALVRSNTQLLPGNLNLVPKFSNSWATTYNAVNCGSPDFGGIESGSFTGIMSAYSSASSPTSSGYTDQFWNNYNPLGFNENGLLHTNLEDTGARPEIGMIPEWDANYVVNGNSNALTAALVLAEVAGGIPWCARDSSTGWAPINFVSMPDLYAGLGPPTLDVPAVTVPSSVGAGTPAEWVVQMNHHPCLAYVPYLLTGDPFYLENLQFFADYCILINYYQRVGNFQQNQFDPASPYTDPLPTSLGSRRATRAWAWGIRTFVAAYLATPASVPSWLQPKSYFKAVLDDNAAWADTWGTNYPGASGHPAYPSQATQGMLPNCLVLESMFMVQYWQGAMAFALNQAGLSNWAGYTAYSAKSLVGMAIGDGVTGWDKRFPTPYSVWCGPLSTDYNSNPSSFSSMYDSWNYMRNQCIPGDRSSPTPWGVNMIGALAPGPPLFSDWAPGTFKCYSWLYELRAGCPQLPNSGDVASITIAGPFTGSPVTLTHTVSSGDVSTLQTNINDTDAGVFSDPDNPITDSLISQINANASLIAAGITANLNNTVPSAGNPGSGAFQTIPGCGRFYIDIHAGPAYITVTGSITTSTTCSVYIQPNGDGVVSGTSSNPALFARPLQYQAAITGTATTGNAPTGTTLQSIITTGDGMKWCFIPELKSYGALDPGPSVATYPNIGFGDNWQPIGGTTGTASFGLSSTPYAVFNPTYLAGIKTANDNSLATIPSVDTAYSNALAAFTNLFASGSTLFNLSIVP